MSWRQHRVELLVTAGLVAVVAIPLVLTGLALHDEYVTTGVAACVSDPGRSANCEQLVDLFLARHTEWGNRFMWVIFLPALIGAFIGAPLLAREYEQGTWKLAFTQSVPRLRWLLSKLAVVAVGVAVPVAVLATLLVWWREPLDAINGRLRTAGFVVAQPSLVASTLFALALGLFAGALLRRVIPAMAVTLVGYAAIRIFVEEAVRPGYLTPLLRITEPGTPTNDGWLPASEWTVGTAWVDGAGHRLPEGEQQAILRELFGGGRPVLDSDTVERYLAEHGLRHLTEYQPGDRFWVFQAIESGWMLVAAVILVGAAAWLVRRRTA